mmetsp:Transcript_113370/g.260017  ORF Transcript_113370/g.260017 Transcript_113370/m.260017 type:complete len:285 (+) Transcript_113370:10368-11222(+)
MAGRASVFHCVLVHQRVGRPSRSMRNDRRRPADVACAGSVPVALLVVSGWASALVGVQHVLTDTGTAGAAGRAIVDVVAPLNASLCDLFIPTLAMARIVIQMPSCRGIVVLACPLVVASHSPRGGAVIDVLARLESGQLTVILTPDGKIADAAEHPSCGIPSVALDHFGASEGQRASASTSSVRRDRGTAARHGLTGLPGSKCSICLARNRKGRRPLRLRVQGEPLLAGIDDLLLESLYHLWYDTVRNGRCHTARHRNGCLRLGVRSISPASDRVTLCSSRVTV